ncbi:hypothetical protein HMPREF0202_01714 [Cetobacterium somerae ATCC BAA-474]|uniref:Uncharacterized protein n=1 Tax=Cetobacterium somerae ATCC BAA-474 TaxID=1319815 RepID=U7V9X1_9FUSO|nr:hypothetical protein [Cetobacterium somerae]ERT68325.1 hypothetical protein HMPREF0202_01714 [Cetobacterium somerae ATCC BAA-474]
MKARLYILNGDIGVELKELSAIEKEDILISSDEISSYTIKYDPIDSKAECNVPVNVSYIIKGKIISEVKDTEKKNSDFLLGNTEFDSSWSKIPQNYYDDVRKLVTTTYSGLNLSPETLNDNVTKLNSRNLIKLKYWMEAFFKVPERTAILELIKNGYTELHVLENAYAYLLEEKGTTGDGNGEFNLVIKQKKRFDKKYIVSIS